MELLCDPEPFLGGIDFGEGPRWHDGRLWYSDFYQHCVCAVSPGGAAEVIVEVPGQPSGLGWMPNGDLLAVSMTERRVMRYDGAALHEHADLSEIASSLCNDMTVDAEGRAYVGNFGFDLHNGEDAAPATLALVQPDGTAEPCADGLMFPNGAVITPDGRTFIIGESFACQFTAFDIGPEGRLENRRLWAAEGGEVTHRVETELNCFAVMLGGDDRRTLFLVTAPGSHPDEVRGLGQGRIDAVRVEVPGAGLP